MYIPVFFGHEGVEKEFKTSAFIHADKNATEEQSLVLARVIASFMNTEGGTLYIGSMIRISDRIGPGVKVCS